MYNLSRMANASNLSLSVMANTFLYFAYGSNLLTERIHVNNPTAVRRDIGYLKNYRLDFITHSKRWHGAVATIVPTEGAHVWGAIWEIENSSMTDLDRQEGVAQNIYFPMMIDVKTPNGTFLKCRVYQQCNNPLENLAGQLLPLDRRPSAVYRDTILRGARESNLPIEYMTFLETIPDNRYNGEVDIFLPLNKS